MYTGYVLDRDLLPGQRKYVPGVTDRILDNVDVLVDGPFVLAERDLSLRFRGSGNQRILKKEQISELRQ
jgi:anaerobic ribonucleoside-triphosphate reductase activating protein